MTFWAGFMVDSSPSSVACGDTFPLEGEGFRLFCKYQNNFII